MIAHPLVLDVADQVLWEKKTTFQLHLTQAITIGPGSDSQYLHRDQWCFDFFPFPDDMQVEVSSMWALTDFVEANGATRVVPGSHKAEDPRAFTSADTVPAEMPRGSVVLYTGRTVHGGGANTSDQARTGVNVDYVLGWLRQEENQYLSVPDRDRAPATQAGAATDGLRNGCVRARLHRRRTRPHAVARLRAGRHRVVVLAASLAASGRHDVAAAHHPVLPIGVVHRHASDRRAGFGIAL